MGGGLNMPRYVTIYSLKCMTCDRIDTQSDDGIDHRRGPECPDCDGAMEIIATQQKQRPDDVRG